MDAPECLLCTLMHACKTACNWLLYKIPEVSLTMLKVASNLAIRKDRMHEAWLNALSMRSEIAHFKGLRL